MGKHDHKKKRKHTHPSDESKPSKISIFVNTDVHYSDRPNDKESPRQTVSVQTGNIDQRRDDGCTGCFQALAGLFRR